LQSLNRLGFTYKFLARNDFVVFEFKARIADLLVDFLIKVEKGIEKFLGTHLFNTRHFIVLLIVLLGWLLCLRLRWPRGL